MSIILCGLQCSGKTTVGKRLAEMLEWNLVDTDLLIESAYAKSREKYASCREICLQEGESFFRQMEKEQIASLKAGPQTVISLGGGALLCDESMKHLRTIGEIVYLKTSTEILWKRITLRGIPTYLKSQEPEKSFYQMASARISVFENSSTYIIETDGYSESELAVEIINIRNKMYGK